MPKPLVSQLTIPSGNSTVTYEIKDAQARIDIKHLYEIVEGGVHFIGVVADPPEHQVYEGDTTDTIKVKDATDPTGKKTVTATEGDIVFQGTNEFIWDGAAWRAFGEATGLKAFAFADTGSTSYTPAGTVSKPSFSGSSSPVTITATDNVSGNYQPKGTVSQPSFSGSSSPVTITVTEDANGNYTPDGTISQPSFTGTGVRLVTGNIAVPSAYTTTFGDKSKDVVQPAASGAVTYTPAGSCSGTAVTLHTTTVNSIEAVGTIPSTTYTAQTEDLAFDWGTPPTKGASKTVADGVESVTDPSFSGTGVRLVGTVDIPGSATTTTKSTTNKTATVSATSGEATYTPAGTIGTPTFTGTKVKIEGTVTPTGTVSTPTFTGTKVQLSGTTTAAGSVSQPSFTGKTATITVTPDTPTP